MYNYSSPLEKKDVVVNLLNLNSYSDVEPIIQGISQASEKYNFTFSEVRYEDLFTLKSKMAVHSLLIIVSEEPFSEDLAKFALNLTDFYSVISIAFSYKSEVEMLSYSNIIERYKALSKDKINFLRPLRISDSSYKVTCDKVIDNSICDSVRIKYKPRQLSEDISIPNDVKTFFYKASELYRNHRLYHRSPSDGYFACRVNDDEGFYITATKTYKDRLDLDRISYVNYFDEENNEIGYSGKYLPSSDSVEAAVFLKKNTEIKSVLHTHSSDRFTRNPEFVNRVLVPISSYGEASLGYLINNALRKVDDGFLIMEDHGEVFCSNSLKISPKLLSLLGSNIEEMKRRSYA